MGTLILWVELLELSALTLNMIIRNCRVIVCKLEKVIVDIHRKNNPCRARYFLKKQIHCLFCVKTL